MESTKEKRLRLWKARQEAEGYDVSGVTTLEQAAHFFDKKEEPEIPEEPEETEEPAASDEPKKPRRQRTNKPKEV